MEEEGRGFVAHPNNKDLLELGGWGQPLPGGHIRLRGSNIAGLSVCMLLSAALVCLCDLPVALQK